MEVVLGYDFGVRGTKGYELEKTHAEDVNEKEKEKVMRHGSNLLWLKRLRQVWSTSLHKTNIRTQEINNNNQNSIETIKGRIESVFGSKSTANAVA